MSLAAACLACLLCQGGHATHNASDDSCDGGLGTRLVMVQCVRKQVFSSFQWSHQRRRKTFEIRV